jgi:cobaltochelatase CobN
LGVEQDLGISDDADQGEALTRIDRFVCDIKEAQFADGLHVFGRMGYEGDQSLAAQSEQQGLRTALCGRRIDSGPAGSPYRGRSDVLPTGRNLFSVDPLSVPSRAAYDQGCLLADELVRRHLQDHGDWPKSLVIDLWGSATMRTAGEEFAMALALLGVRPVWAEGSERITGTEIIPLAEMDRPRIDATLRVSGLFRDVFPTLSVLYNQAVRALAARDEAPDWNPFTTHDQHRVFGPAPGEYGVAMQGALDDYSDAGVADAGTAWLAQSSWSIDGDNMDHAPAKIAERVRAADTFVHLQDLAESDVLMAADYAAHEAGFAAAKAQFGQQAILYHLDTTNPSAPKARTLKEEIAKTVMARAANPDWISGMMRHGFRGGAEMAATLDHMGAFANLAKLVEAHHFDRYFQETLGRDDVVDFLREHNPQALNAMIERFDALAEAGLWITRRNSISSELAQLRQSRT